MITDCKWVYRILKCNITFTNYLNIVEMATININITINHDLVGIIIMIIISNVNISKGRPVTVIKAMMNIKKALMVIIDHIWKLWST